MVVRRVLQLVVRDRQLETIAKNTKLVLFELLRLVCHVSRLDALAEGPAFDRLREDHRRHAVGLRGHLVGAVELPVVVSAPAKPFELLVTQVGGDFLEPRVRSEEMLPDESAGLNRVELIVTVERLHHLLDEHAVGVAGE